jgi:hypothetical protein
MHSATLPAGAVTPSSPCVPTRCSRPSNTPGSTTPTRSSLRKLIAVALLIVDDFALDGMDATESRDVYEILTERHRAGSLVVTSNRGPDEWLAMFADPVRAQSAIDRFTSSSYDLVIEGESYRRRLKPSLPGAAGATSAPPSSGQGGTSRRRARRLQKARGARPTA